MQLEVEPFFHFVGKRCRVTFGRPLIRQFGEIVCFELDAVKFVVAAQLPDFLLGFLLREDDVSVFVTGEFVEEVLFREFLPVLLFRADLLGNIEVGHDGRMVDSVSFHLVAYLACVGQRFGHVGEDGVHLGLCLEPFLLGVEHTAWIVQFAACR